MAEDIAAATLKGEADRLATQSEQFQRLADLQIEYIEAEINKSAERVREYRVFADSYLAQAQDAAAKAVALREAIGRLGHFVETSKMVINV